MYVFNSLSTGKERKRNWKTKAYFSSRISRRKTYQDNSKVPYTHKSVFAGLVTPSESWSRWGFHTTLQQWISSVDVCLTVVLWQICPMATWWTCSVLTTPQAPQFLLPWRESTHNHHSPRSLPLLAPAFSAPSPVPWSKPHKQLQDWLIIQQVLHHLWLRNPRSSWLLMMHTQSGKSS